MREADPGDRFYIVVRGRVEVMKRTAIGELHQLATLEIGDHFGEIAQMRESPRTAAVRTLTPCILLTLSRSQFLRFLGKAPEVREAMNQMTKVYLKDPSTLGNYTFIPMPEFEARWHDECSDSEGRAIRLVHLGITFSAATRPAYDPKALMPLR